MAALIPTQFSHHPLYKNQAAKFPAILNSFLLGVDCIRQVPTWVGGGRSEVGRMVVLNF